jgi:hypothetical protein
MISVCPFGTVSLDIVGPVRISCSGFKYILEVQDQLSCWVRTQLEQTVLFYTILMKSRLLKKLLLE